MFNYNRSTQMDYVLSYGYVQSWHAIVNVTKGAGDDTEGLFPPLGELSINILSMSEK